MRLFWLLPVLFLLSAMPAAAEQRFALLIGNSAYAENIGPLQNPVNDIKLVGDALKSLKFEVTSVSDADYSAIHKAVTAHAKRVAAAGAGTISFVYYSGHGAADASTGVNYLIPVDVKDPEASSLWENSIDLKGDILDRLADTAPAAIHFVVFDACRNELRLTVKDKKVLTVDGKTFVPIERTGGVFVAYSTAPGRTASDAGEGSGPYARALAEEVVRPGVEAVYMFRLVQLRVNTSQGQMPWLGPVPSIPAVYLAGKQATDTAREDSPLTVFERERESTRRTMAVVLAQLKSEGVSPSGIVEIRYRWPKGTRAIHICFLDGPLAARVRVAEAARQWTLYGNIDFDFGDWQNPRICNASEPLGDVRITFRVPGIWSFVGTQNRFNSDPDQPSMSLYELDKPETFDSEQAKVRILHEFGHILGFTHNWSSAPADCETEMDWDHIYATLMGPPNFWTREQIDQEIRLHGNGADSVALDRKSVMNLEFPISFFLKGKESRCWLEPRAELSLRDKLAVYVSYP